MHHLQIIVNGQSLELEVESGERLIDLLRDRLGLCGTKEACGQGECGACTVLLAGKAVHSCLVLAVQAEGLEVITIEGLAIDGVLDPLQEEFINQGAIQCGYCTPGMIMSAKGLLLENKSPTLNDIKDALAGNLCRCTGYVKILAAVQAAAKR